MENQNQSLKPGAFLRNGEYRIEKILGQGGFGITYLAYDLSLERHVAIKEFFPKDFCDRDESTSHVTLGTQSASDLVGHLRIKFLKEARNIAKLDHPNIIRIHSAFEENDTAYYVMDYVEGISISEMVKRYRPIPLPRALTYITKIGEALDYVHSFRINHLDVKPANIMVRVANDSPLLIDFGLSKQYDDHGGQTSATPLGISAGYAPIEQYNQNGIMEFSPASDVYSLAATLYYMLSGVVPPEATTLIHEDLQFPPSIPRQLHGAIAKAMSPSKRMRHSTIGEFIDEINGRKAQQSYDQTVVVNPKKKNRKAMKAVEIQNVELEAAPVVPQPAVSAPLPPTPSAPAPQPVAPAPQPVAPAPHSQQPANPQPEPQQPQQPAPKKPEPAPKQPEPIAGISQPDPEESYAQPDNSRKKTIILSAIGAAAIIGIVIGAVMMLKGNDNPTLTETETDTEVVTEDSVVAETAEASTVENMAFMPGIAQLGECLYTGEVNAEGVPSGHGVAKWSKGSAVSYDGEWKDGKMDGKCEYELRSGDTFKGTFKDNYFNEGTYTQKSTGDYFVGTFKNGQPDKGSWYNASGKKL